MIKLFGYWRSSAAYRVRIALNLKRIEHQLLSINLLKGEERQATFAEINPQKLVPVLDHDGRVLTQSMAILEYLDEAFPQPTLLPENRAVRAAVRALANVIACDIHPLNNLRVLQYLSNQFELGEDTKLQWYQHWVIEGFDAIEALLERSSDGRFCFGESASLADVLLIPQVYNANRFDVDLKPYPLIDSINRNCLSNDAFARAAPERQPDSK